MLFFNVMEIVGVEKENEIMLRVDYNIETAYVDPEYANFSRLLCVQVDTKPPIPGISSFNSWNTLIDKAAHWRDQDWLIHVVQPIENGDSCLIVLVGRKEVKHYTGYKAYLPGAENEPPRISRSGN